jgi:4-amino-4-deoxy-L-arabinose transferase-like glycosyltransferase
MRSITFQNLTTTSEKSDDLLNIKKLIAAYSLFLIINSFFLVNHFDTYYYWSWGQHLTLGYVDGPPLIAFFMHLFDFLFGNTLFAINLCGVFTTLCITFFVFKIAETLFNNQQIGLTAALLWLISPNTTEGLLLKITYNNLEQLFWLTTTFFILDYVKLKANKSLYYAGISLGLLLLSKYSGVILLLALILFFISVPTERNIFKNKHLYFAILLAFLIFSPHLIWNAQHNWIAFNFQLHAHTKNTTSLLSILDCLKGIIKDHGYAILLVSILAIKHRNFQVNTVCWKLLCYVFLTLLFFWLLASYFSKPYHGYLQLLNVPLTILLSYYLIKFHYNKTLWMIILAYSIALLLACIRVDLESHTRHQELTLLKKFDALYFTDPTQPILVGNDYTFLSKVFFTHPLRVVSSTPLCDSAANQFRYWNLDFQKALIAHQIPSALYIDHSDSLACIKPYFEKCTQLPPVENSPPNKKTEVTRLYIYRCQNE